MQVSPRVFAMLTTPLQRKDIQKPTPVWSLEHGIPVTLFFQARGFADPIVIQRFSLKEYS